MDYGHLFRRAFHLCAPLILVYYLLPHRFLGISKEAWLLLGLFGLLILEAVRLFTGRIFFGLREYERKQISAYAWAGIGVTIAFLFFPIPFVICSVVGLGWTDPLIGEMRKRKMMRYYPATPLAVYFIIAAACLFMSSNLSIIQVLILGFVGSVAAISVEKPKLPIDDDFLMLIVPLVALTLVYEYLIIAGLV
jgi:dolichol kinase